MFIVQLSWKCLRTHTHKHTHIHTQNMHTHARTASHDSIRSLAAERIELSKVVKGLLDPGEKEKIFNGDLQNKKKKKNNNNTVLSVTCWETELYILSPCCGKLQPLLIFVCARRWVCGSSLFAVFTYGFAEPGNLTAVSQWDVYLDRQTDRQTDCCVTQSQPASREIIEVK